MCSNSCHVMYVDSVLQSKESGGRLAKSPSAYHNGSIQQRAVSHLCPGPGPALLRPRLSPACKGGRAACIPLLLPRTLPANLCRPAALQPALPACGRDITGQPLHAVAAYKTTSTGVCQLASTVLAGCHLGPWPAGHPGPQLPVTEIGSGIRISLLLHIVDGRITAMPR